MKNQNFLCIGMSRPGSFTLIVNGEHCWATNGLPEDRFDALFKWAKSDSTFWKQKVQAQCDFDEYAEDGTPINAIVRRIKINV